VCSQVGVFQDTARVLLLCSGQHSSSGRAVVVALLLVRARCCGDCFVVRTSILRHHHHNMPTPPLLQMSHAVERKNHSSLRNALLFGLIVFVFWILTLVVPFYAWALIVFAALLYHRYRRVA
jgi:hypothetical protein